VEKAESPEGTITLTDAQLGELSVHLGIHLNTKSTGGSGQLTQFLYEHKGYRKQFVKEKGKNTERLSCDDLSMLRLLRLVKDAEKHVLRDLLSLQQLRTEISILSHPADKDGRIRCSYNVVGTKTGRLTCYASNTGSGYNLQTVTGRHKRLFLPDDGYYLFQCDLSGADSWTVAARCAMQGDDTMLEDLRAGVKPHCVVALLYNGVELPNDRAELVELSKTVDQSGWLYRACKRVNHGTCYLMGPTTMSNQIMEDSYKGGEDPVYVPGSTCKQLAGLFTSRYWGLGLWHRWVQEQLFDPGTLTSASGHTRTFYGPKSDRTTLGDAVATEPQENTTYSTMMALQRCWEDPDNWIGRRPILEPLHTVHDSLVLQGPIDRLDWCKERLRSWFDNKITIGDTTLVIPAEMSYGPNWKDQTEF
jgi:hypothetical protein